MHFVEQEIKDLVHLRDKGTKLSRSNFSHEITKRKRTW